MNQQPSTPEVGLQYAPAPAGEGFQMRLPGGDSSGPPAIPGLGLGQVASSGALNTGGAPLSSSHTRTRARQGGTSPFPASAPVSL